MQIIKKVFTINLILLLVLINLNSYTYASSVNDSSLKKSIKKVNSYLKNNIDYNQPEYLTEIVDDNKEVPAYSYYPKHVSSRGIKTLKAFNGKIFMGLGDWNDNTGPTKILYYDTKSNKVVSSGTIADEAIETFTIIDKKLYTTGTDPKAAWGYGSYYQYNETDNKWEQHQKKHGWIHIFKMVEFENKLFLCGSTQKNFTPIQYSDDNGEVFNNIFLYKDSEQLPFDEELRCYNLISYDNNLYGFVASTNNKKIDGIYKYDSKENKFNYIANLPDSSIHWFARFPKHSIFKNKFIYLSGSHVYSTTDFKQFTPILANLFGKTVLNPDYVFYSTGTENAQDSLVVDDTLYLLTYKKDGNSYLARIYATKDLSTTQLIYELETPSTPFTFEYYDNSFYIGTNVGYSSKLDDSVKNRKFI